MSRRRAVSGLVLASLVFLAACGGDGGAADPGASGNFPLTIRNCGQDITIEKRPERVFLLGDEAVSVLTAVGELDRAVGRSGELQDVLYDERTRAALRRVPLVGQGTDPSGTDKVSLEAVLAQRPDVVLGNVPDDSGVNRASLARVGIPLITFPEYCSDPEQVARNASFDDVYAQVRQYGRLFDAEEKAASTVAELRRQVTASRQPIRELRGRSAAALFVYLGGTPPSAYGNPSIAHAQIEALGLRNVFGDVARRNFEVSREVLLAKNPDVLILLYVGGDPETIEREFRAAPGADRLAAVRTGDIVVQKFGFSGSPTPLSVTGLQRIARTLGTPDGPARTPGR